MASGMTDNLKLSFDNGDRKSCLEKNIVYRRKSVFNGRHRGSSRTARAGNRGKSASKGGGRRNKRIDGGFETHAGLGGSEDAEGPFLFASWVEFVSKTVTQGRSFAYWLREEISSALSVVVFSVVDWVTNFTESSPVFDFWVQCGISLTKKSKKLSNYVKGLRRRELLFLPLLFLIAFPLVLILLSVSFFMIGISSISIAVLTVFLLFSFLVFSIILVPFVITAIIVVGSGMIISSLFSKADSSFYKELFVQEDNQFKKRLRNIADSFPKPFISDGKEALLPGFLLPDYIKDTSLARMFVGEDTPARRAGGYNVVAHRQDDSQDLNDIIRHEDPIKLSLVADDAPESSTTNSGFESSIIRVYALDSNASGDGHLQT